MATDGKIAAVRRRRLIDDKSKYFRIIVAAFKRIRNSSPVNNTSTYYRPVSIDACVW